MNDTTSSSAKADSGELVVAAHSVLALEPAHVAEARRALLAQGRDVGEAAVIRLLWIARCLPAALDVLADARSPLPLAGAVFVDVDVELGEPPLERRALLAVAHVVTGGVIVEVVEKRALVLARDDEVAPCCTVRLSLARDAGVGSDEAAGEKTDVAVHRFTLRSPAR